MEEDDEVEVGEKNIYNKRMEVRINCFFEELNIVQTSPEDKKSGFFA